MADTRAVIRESIVLSWQVATSHLSKGSRSGETICVSAEAFDSTSALKYFYCDSSRSRVMVLFSETTHTAVDVTLCPYSNQSCSAY